MIAPLCFFVGFHDTVDSLLKHPDVRVLWHTYCGSRDRVDTDTFLDAVRHHLAADPTVDPAAALDLLSGDNRAALASALDAKKNSSGQVRAHAKRASLSVASSWQLAWAWSFNESQCSAGVTEAVALCGCHAGVRQASEWRAGHDRIVVDGLAAGGSDRRTGH